MAEIIQGLLYHWRYRLGLRLFMLGLRVMPNGPSKGVLAAHFSVYLRWSIDRGVKELAKEA